MSKGRVGAGRRRARLLMAALALGAPLAHSLVVGAAPPRPEAERPAATTTAPISAHASKPVSGGGEAPHGALPMHKQHAAFDKVIKAMPPGAPAGIDPAFWKVIVPADNAMNDARVALGRRLFFDARLSRDGTVACATCHDISRGFTDRRGTSEGVGDRIGQRNAPTTMNAFLFSSQFLDGRVATLEEQATLPIINPIEMGMPDDKAVMAAIAKDPEYAKMFQAAYGRAPTFGDVGRAIAAFERTLVFLDAPFDRFLAGDLGAIDDDAKAGWILFNGKARCGSCHQMSSSSPIGSDNRFHNIGVSARHQDFEGLAKKALEALGKDASKETIDRLALETNLSELGRFVVTRDHGAVHARRLDRDALGRDGPLQQGRRGEPVPRWRNRAARPDREGDRSGRLLPLRADRRALRRRQQGRARPAEEALHDPPAAP